MSEYAEGPITIARLWRSRDGRYGLSLQESHIQDMVRHCRRAGRIETGGILIGHYNQERNCAVVTRVAGPSRDSHGFPMLFRRGTLGLQSLLNKVWRGGQEFYLGEWHFHPGVVPRPSGLDRDQMRLIALSPKYRCPEPVLMIIGGSSIDGWTASVAVFPQGALVELGPSAEILGEAKVTDTHPPS